MSIFSRRKKAAIEPRWTFRCEGILWRMLFSTDGHIVGEERFPETKTTSFFCLDERAGTPRWVGKEFDESWWIGIEDVDASRIYFHGFAKPDMPRHAGITAFEIGREGIVWSRSDCTFVHAQNGRVYAMREGFEQLHFVALDAATGDTIEEEQPTAASIQVLRESDAVQSRYSNFRYPQQHEPADLNFAAFSPALASMIQTNALRGTVDLLAFNTFAAFAWHEATGEAHETGELLRQRMVVWDEKKTAVVFEATLHEAMLARSYDSFFMKGDLLFFIRNMNEIVALDFSNGSDDAHHH